MMVGQRIEIICNGRNDNEHGPAALENQPPVGAVCLVEEVIWEYRVPSGAAIHGLQLAVWQDIEAEQRYHAAHAAGEDLKPHDPTVVRLAGTELEGMAWRA